MAEEGEENDSLAIAGPCSLCLVNTAKYRCPGCSIQSCSLICSQEHKKNTGCNGKRIRTTHHDFIPASKLTAEIIVDDQFLLDGAQALTNNPTIEQSKKRYHWELVKKCRTKSITLSLMPLGMKRVQQNKSRIVKDNKILWTIEWIFLKEANDLPDHPINMKLEELNKYVRETRYSQCHESDTIFTSFEKLPPIPNNNNNDSTRISLESKTEQTSPSSNLFNGEFLLKLELDRNTNPNPNPLPSYVDISLNKRLWPVHTPKDTTWTSLLANRTVVEFPTVYIIHHDNKSCG